MAGAEQYLIDQDSIFIKVDTQIPANELTAGIAADAVNKRFEDGRAWPRYGVQSQPWGTIPVKAANLIPIGSNYAVHTYTIGLNVGETYRLVFGHNELFGNATATNGATLISAPDFTLSAGVYVFIAISPILTLKQNLVLASVTAKLTIEGKPRGYSRFNDPEGFDSTVVLTDEWRTGAGEDGGRGRAYRLISGNQPYEIPLNGHDIYGEARLVPCFNGLLLLRQDIERHYFQAAALDTGTSQIQLNAAPNWKDGDLVLFFAFPSSYVLGTNPPNPNTTYRVKIISGNKAELYRDSALTQQIDFTGGALGSFYLERRSTQPGFFGAGAPPLLMQTDGTGATVWQIGFKAVPPFVEATAFDGTSLILNVANHRLTPGDQITYTHTTAATETFWVNPVSPDALRLFGNVDAALGGLLAAASTPSPAFTAGDFIAKAGASGLPMPPMREGVYLQVNRLVGINQSKTLPISDPLDPLHFTPFLSTVNASLGEGDQANGLVEMSKDRFVIGKDNSLLQFLGISQSSSGWQLTNLTKEFGWLAPLAMIAVGKDAWGLSRKGITSVFQTDQGEIQGLADPISRPMKKYIDQIDWIHARQACAAAWNNRVFFAVPLKGQPANNVRNNAVLVYNILNGGWEGIWRGPTLQVYNFARCVVYGQERLTFLNYAGQVLFFDPDALTDGPLPIADLLVSRTYTTQDQVMSGKPKLWLIADITWDTWQPSLTVKAGTPGFNEEFVLAANATYNKTKYFVNGRADYNPAAPANFSDPYRQDYAPSVAELTAGPLDVHQDITERFRMRVNHWGVQISVANANGSARIQSIIVRAMPTLTVASKKV